METKRLPVLVVESSDAVEFEEKCKKLIEENYTLIASSCGFVDSAAYDFCGCYQAIFQDTE